MPRKLLTVLLFLTLGCAFASAQNKLSGIVKDDKGNPLPGVSVFEKGTENGGVTDAEGAYSIRKPADGATVEYAFMGMVTENFVYKGEATHNVVMHDDAMFLSETVFVGYGIQKKSSLTSSISVVKGDDLLKGPSTNVTQNLAGLLPGLTSVQESGEPGLDQASLRIRGSVYGIAYVVDGFPVNDINGINVADIESISLLKDAAAASVYGLKASGGVMLITTRRGDKGKTKVSYTGQFGASMNANFPQFMNGPQFAYYYNVAQMMDQMANGEISSVDQYVPYFTKRNVEAMVNGNPADGWDNVDYVNKVFKTGFTQNHSVTVQGGNDKVRFFTSFGYLGQKGNIDNFNYRRYNMRANIDGKIGKNFSYKVGLSGTIGRRQSPAFVSGGSEMASNKYFSVARQTIQMHPYLPEQYEGLYTGSQMSNTKLLVSPLAAIYESGYKNTNSAEMNANVEFQYDFPFLKGLSIKAAGSYTYGNSYNKNLSIPYSLMWLYKTELGDWEWVKRADSNVHSANYVNNLGEGVTFGEQLVGQGSLSYKNSFGLNNIDALALLEVREVRGNNLAAYAQNLPFVELPELSNGVAANNPVSGGSSASRSAGYVFRLKYDYDEKYLAEFTGRYDGSYKFAGMTKTRWGFFPSGSIGWRISKEDFMRDVTCINDLKIRGSVGLTGNDNVNEYMFLSTYSKYDSKVAYGMLNGANAISHAYYSSGIPNTELTWEKTLSWNVGFDLTMWRGLLGMEVDAFYNHTYDMLTPQSSGFPSSMGGYYPTWVNKNAIESKGIDVMLTHKNHVNLGGHTFWYDISGSVTYSHTRWLKYNDDPNIVDYRKVVGTTYGSLLCWQADGLFRSEEEIDNASWYGTRPNLGDIRYVDLNGDGKIDEDDKGFFGRSNRPQLVFGLNFNLSWNGIDLSAQFTGGALCDVSMTGTYYNDNDDNSIWTQSFKEGANSPLFLVQNAYSEFNKNGTFPRLTLSTASHGGDNGLSSTFWIRDGKYLRLKTAQLGYTLPKKWMDAVKIEKVRFFIEGQNIFTISGLPEGIDPESPGVNNGYYPQQRVLMGGVTLTF